MHYNMRVSTLHNISFSILNILEGKPGLVPAGMVETGRIIYSNQSVTINLVVALAGFLFILACK